MAEPADMREPLTEGHRVGEYRIVRLLGRGGMGAVYEALQQDLDRRVALKLLFPQHARHPELATRFFNEARAANIIRHRGIVDIYGFGHHEDGAPYIVMEYLEGESLRARIRRLGSLSDVVRVGRQIAAALAAAHDKGIVHRDLKPDNVMLIADPEVPGGERVKILDFGIAKLSEELLRPRDAEARTQTGVLMGTPTYMSPEQCRNTGGVEARSDVYSLGVILYQGVSGRAPFQGSEAEVLGGHLFREPRPLGEACPDADPALVALIHAMLAKEQANRPTMAEVAARLEQLGAGAPSPDALPAAGAPSPDALPAPAAPRAAAARSRWLAVAGAVALLGLAGVVLLVLRLLGGPPAAPAPAAARATPAAQPRPAPAPVSAPPPTAAATPAATPAATAPATPEDRGKAAPAPKGPRSKVPPKRTKEGHVPLSRDDYVE